MPTILERPVSAGWTLNELDFSVFCCRNRCGIMADQVKDLLRVINRTHVNTLIFRKCKMYTSEILINT